MMVEPYKPLYTIKEAAKVLLTNADGVYALINSGQLPCLRLGSMKVRGTDLERFIEKYPVGEREEGQANGRSITDNRLPAGQAPGEE